jgi:hypothetical protein
VGVCACVWACERFFLGVYTCAFGRACMRVHVSECVCVCMRVRVILCMWV